MDSESLYLKLNLIALHFQNVFTVIIDQREKVPFRMTIETGDFVLECFLEQLRMGTIRFEMKKNYV